MTRLAGALLCGVVIALVTAVAAADVTLPAVISDNMVLQQGAKLPVWGTADAGEKVTVSIGKQKAEATADDKGKWKVTLEPLAATSEPQEMTVAGKDTITVKNILVGEVWLCSGQSNMEMLLKSCKDAKEDAAAADNPSIRLYKVRARQWQVCTPATAEAFSGVGYYFGRELHKQLKVPVGLINSSVGGTPIESWTSMEVQMTDPDLADVRATIEKQTAGLAAAKEKHNEAMKAWRETTQAIAATNPAATQPGSKLLPPAPPAPQDPKQRYGNLYSSMIDPLIPFGIAGAIWYQGEANASVPGSELYAKQLPAMIRTWRKAWGSDFAFLVVQLPNYMAATKDPNMREGWPIMRESQAKATSMTKVGMAVIIDLGDARDIHPKDKAPVGYRLSLAAMAVAYGKGKDMVTAGPMFDSMKVDGDKVRVKFTSVGGGLVAKGDKLEGFAIAGEDGQYSWADAKIDGDSVILSAEGVAKPVSVRYAFLNNPKCNLFNKEGLPASPFRAGEKAATSQPK